MEHWRKMEYVGRTKLLLQFTINTALWVFFFAVSKETNY